MAPIFPIAAGQRQTARDHARRRWPRRPRSTPARRSPTSRPEPSYSEVAVEVLRPTRPRAAPTTTCRSPGSGRASSRDAHPAQHHQPVAEAAGPAARAVEGRPGERDRSSACGVQVAATRSGFPSTGPLKIRNPSPSARSTPHTKQPGNGDRVPTDVGILRGPRGVGVDRLHRGEGPVHDARGGHRRARGRGDGEVVGGGDGHRGVQRGRRVQGDLDRRTGHGRSRGTPPAHPRVQPPLPDVGGPQKRAGTSRSPVTGSAPSGPAPRGAPRRGPRSGPGSRCGRRSRAGRGRRRARGPSAGRSCRPGRTCGPGSAG